MEKNGRNGFITIEKAAQGTPFFEAYGLLLASILLGYDGKPPSVVAVTAARAGDGVSTTAVNLAMMMARTNRPTLLIDANMREPGLHRAFGLAQKPGLAELLVGKADRKAVTAATRIPQLSLIPAGEAPLPAQVLASQPGLGELIGVLRGHYDLIVIDTPPVLQYPDALHIAKTVDGVLQVVFAGRAIRREQQESRQLLERVGARLLGTVMNQVAFRGKALVQG
jgi:capsular exopolysaccharide synthesis family protein